MNALQVYVLTENVGDRGAEGEKVVLAQVYDYGLARDDSKYLGVRHVSVSRDLSTGGYPTFTVPRDVLLPHND